MLQHMESEQEAQKAIRSLNGHILNGNRLNVEVIVQNSLTSGSVHIMSLNFFYVYEAYTFITGTRILTGTNA